MNKEIMRAAGFTKEVGLVEQGKCPFCKKDVMAVPDAFRNESSLKEYKISGLCQECQDLVFGKD
jgi:hypothetical protein